MTRQAAPEIAVRLREIAAVEAGPEDCPVPREALAETAKETDGLFAASTGRIDEEPPASATRRSVSATMAVGCGNIDGANGWDVFPKEPVPAGHPLLSLPNVAALPHIGSAACQARSEMACPAAENLIAVFSGKEPLTPV
jgi:lactate dehydrogenase-like 2-hydroxyacid dehydrogenase